MSAAGEWRGPGVRRATPADAIAHGRSVLEGPDDDASAIGIWWEVTEPALVLSRGGRVGADAEACAAAGVKVVTRASGGGPVLWNAGLASLDIFVPRRHRLWSPDVVESYRWFGEVLAAGLRAAGVAGAATVPPDAARRVNDPARAAQACYCGVSAWEVLDGSRKLVGLSQVRRRRGTLLQAGVAHASQAPVAGLLALPPDERAVVERLLTGADMSPLPPIDTIRSAIDAAIATVMTGPADASAGH